MAEPQLILRTELLKSWILADTISSFFAWCVFYIFSHFFGGERCLTPDSFRSAQLGNCLYCWKQRHTITLSDGWSSDFQVLQTSLFSFFFCVFLSSSHRACNTAPCAIIEGCKTIVSVVPIRDWYTVKKPDQADHHHGYCCPSLPKHTVTVLMCAYIS